MYYPIWQRIKNRDVCEIMVARSQDAARIRKAVIKEKNMDLAFKIMNDIDPHRLHITYDEKVGKMTFVLKQQLGIGLVEKVVV